MSKYYDGMLYGLEDQPLGIDDSRFTFFRGGGRPISSEEAAAAVAKVTDGRGVHSRCCCSA